MRLSWGWSGMAIPGPPLEAVRSQCSASGGKSEEGPGLAPGAGPWELVKRFTSASSREARAIRRDRSPGDFVNAFTSASSRVGLRVEILPPGAEAFQASGCDYRSLPAAVVVRVRSFATPDRSLTRGGRVSPLGSRSGARGWPEPSRAEAIPSGRKCSMWKGKEPSSAADRHAEDGGGRVTGAITRGGHPSLSVISDGFLTLSGYEKVKDLLRFGKGA